MRTLIIVGLITLFIVEVITIAVTIAWESLPMECTPTWLDNLYHFIIRN